MDDAYGPFLFEEEYSPEQREALREELEENPELAAEWIRWQRVRAELRHRLQEQLPDRRLLVLYALEEEGRDEALTPKEKRALDAARDDIVRAIDVIPALSRVVERIQDECADFETVWADHKERIRAGATAPERSSDRDERAPRQSSHSRFRERPTMRRWTWGLTVAALFLGAVVLALFYGPQEAQTTVTAAAGEQRIVEFDDGSSVRLVGAATLSYEAEATSTEERRVSLTHGRAYFDVAPREEASFVVNTPAARAEALGTQFGVTTGSDTTEIVLVEGKVRVGSSDETAADPVVLQPGQRSLVREGTAPAPPTPADLTARLEWTGLFVFRTVPTTTIAERLSEHYEVSISVASALTGESVTGTFERDQSVTQILETIARTLEAEVQSEEEDTYRLVPAS